MINQEQPKTRKPKATVRALEILFVSTALVGLGTTGYFLIDDFFTNKVVVPQSARRLASPVAVIQDIVELPSFQWPQYLNTDSNSTNNYANSAKSLGTPTDRTNIPTSYTLSTNEVGTQ